MDLKTDEISERLGLSDPIVDVWPESAHVGEDGVALVVCSLWVNAEDPHAGTMVVAFDGQRTDIALVKNKLAPRVGWHCGNAAYENGLIFLHRRTKPSEDQTLAVLIPRQGMQWGEPQALAVSPDLPSRVTSKGFISQVLPSKKGIGINGQIAWPVQARTGSDETSVQSIAFFQPDVRNGQLNWSYWPKSEQTKGIIKRLFGKDRNAQTPNDFIRPNPSAFPAHKWQELDLPNVCSAFFDGSRVLITSDGASVVKRYGDRCAAISEVQPDGRIHHFYLEDFIATDRPDRSKYHDYQARFVAGGRKVLLKSRYKSTDPWKGGFALFDIEDQSLAVCAGPKGEDYLGPMEIVDNSALFVAFDAENSCLQINLEQITFG